jgi:hypothetical protein
MSISQNFPDEGPSLNLNFASSRRLDPRITFTRTSTGTYTDKNGLVTIAPTDTPRFDHSYDGSNVQSLGLLIEESRTNLSIYSEQFDNAAWSRTSGTTVVSNATTAPDGNLTADRIVYDGSGTAGNYRIYTGALTSVLNQSYTASIWLKADSAITVRLYGNGVAGPLVTCNLTTQWQRFSTSGTGNGISSVQLLIYSNASDNTAISFYAWGAQLEAGAFPTSYIPTVASTVTRSADNASMTGTNFTSWYNPSEGGIITIVNTAPLYGSVAQVYCSISDGTENNRMVLYRTAGGLRGEVAVTVSSVQTSLTSTIDDALNSSKYKMAFAYKTNDMNAVFAGSISSGITTSVPTSTQLNIGDRATGSRILNGTISQLSYYPKRLTNSQLQNLTK